MEFSIPEGGFLPLTSDYVFKKVCLGKNKKALPTILNLIEGRTGPQVLTDLQILSTENQGESKGARKIIFDILAKDSQGIMYNIEVQKLRGQKLLTLLKRFFYYICRLHGSQLVQGDDFELIRPSVLLCITTGGFLFPELDELCVRQEVLIQTHPHRSTYTPFLVYFVQLDRLKGISIEETKNAREGLCTMILSIHELKEENKLKKALTSYPELNPIVENLRSLSLDPAARLEYEKSESERLALLREGEEEGIEKGKAEGMKEGIQKGKAEGMKEGIEKGKAEGIQKVVRAALGQNLSLKTISALTGLSEEEIRQLEAN